MRLLLTHSSGAGYDFLYPRLKRYMEYTVISSKVGGRIDDMFSLPLLFKPGEGWAYGSGISWAGKVVEKLTGQSLGAYMEENIFKPLGISRIMFFPQDNPALAGQLSDMSIRDDSHGKLAAAPSGLLLLFGHLRDHLGGEEAYADLQDYMKILRSLLLDEGKLARSETTQLMFQPQLPTEEARARLREEIEDPSWAVGDFSVPRELDWGYGGVVVVGDAHPIQRRGYLSWSGAANLYRVSMACQRSSPTTQLTQLVYRSRGRGLWHLGHTSYASG